MHQSDNYIIKSFKHNGRLHRMWMENLRVPDNVLAPGHAEVGMIVTVNCRTKIVEADESVWFSRSPGVSFFIPQEWYNIVALVEQNGIRYYCNVASPPYVYGNILTYIDYDLDLILTPSGDKFLVDQDEYERHKISFHYSPVVEEKVQDGLLKLTSRMDARSAPFEDEWVLKYYDWWKKERGETK
jgi:protein associated with RNAse G/E